ncbi:MAG: DUF4062 domain-containing protein [Aestuariivirga sp.]
MADTKKHIRVFLASPGDLREERIAANAMVDHINKMLSDFEGYHVDLVGWEDTLPQYGRAQAVINQDLETCELFVGILWERWGTPPSKHGLYTSGFEEEYEIAITSRREKNRPEIFLFLKDMDPKLLRSPGEETKKILAFRENLIASKEIKFETTKDVRDFELKFMHAIVAYVQRLVKADREKQQSETQSTPAEASPSHIQERPAPDSPLAPEGASFLRDFITLTEKEGGSDNIKAIDVARFRLLSRIVSKQGNDEESLGAHDANLLFVSRDLLTLGSKEISGLEQAGLNYFQSENVPLWHWYAREDGFNKKFLGFYALRASKVPAGALAAMALIEEPLPKIRDLGRDLFLDFWFAKNTQSEVKVAALNYLGECGFPSDIQKIKIELARGDYQTRGVALDAIIRINLREGRQKALEELFELQTDQISERMLGLLFEHPQSLSQEILEKGIAQRNDVMRRTCVTELARRKKLSTDTAERLLEDNDAEVRFMAIKALINAGRKYTEEEGRKILVRQTSGGLFSDTRTTVGDAQFTAFQKLVRTSKSEEELAELAKRSSIFDRSAECALLESRFDRDSATLFDLINDRYKQAFVRSLAEMISLHGEDSQLIKDTKGLEDYLRRKFLRDAIDIVLRKSDAKSLPFVRNHLSDSSLAYSEHDLEYLGKYGEWQDIPLIVSLVGRVAFGVSLLSNRDGKKTQLAAKALHRISRGRTGELIEIKMPSDLQMQVIHSLSDKEFKTLSDEQIEGLLLSESDGVRKVTALKCVHSFAKKRLIKTLQSYIEDDKQRYYNVIHWLDLGVSAPKEIALRSAAKVLARERSA